MRIVHAADLHIDSPLRGLVAYEGAPIAAVREATRPALGKLVAYCIDAKASLLLIAGDLFDDDWKDFSTGLFFNKEMSRLRDAGIRVAFVRGNHDAASHITRALRPPDNVKEFSSRKAETITYDDLGVAVHGRSFPERAVTSDLSREYPLPIVGALNIGLLHTCVEGRVGHEPYAPCNVQSLRDHGYDYWALGHVHRREVISTDPWIVFPGNLQGRHVRETGSKGATSIEVVHGKIESVEHIALDVVRWAEVVVDVEANASVHDMLDASRVAMSAELDRAESRVLAARVVIRGPESAARRVAAEREKITAELQGIANELRDVYFEKLKIEGTREARIVATGEWVDALATLSDVTDAELVAMAADVLADVRSKLPHEVTSGPDALDLTDVETLRALLREAEQSIVAKVRP